MGIVEILPGISGGTIALLTGIYEQLVLSLKQLGSIDILGLDFTLLRESLRFLAPLGVGMLLGVAIAVGFVTEFVDSQPRIFWGVIFGLVMGAAIELARNLEFKQLLYYAPVGVLIGLPFILIPDQSTHAFVWMYFLGGMAAFLAWLLPGISGSMVLLLLGLWLPILEALRTIEITKLALFLAGVALALAVFPRLLLPLLLRFRTQLIGVFVGLIASTLWRAWPWKFESGSLYVPTDFSAESQLLTVCVAMLIGLLLIFGVMTGLRRVS